MTFIQGSNHIKDSDPSAYFPGTDTQRDINDVLAEAIPKKTWSLQKMVHGRMITDTGTGEHIASDAIVANSTSVARASEYLLWEDAKQEGFAFGFMVPPEFDTASIMTATFIGSLAVATGRGTDTIEIEMQGYATAEDESISSGTAMTSVAVTKTMSTHENGDVVTVDLGTIFAASTLTAGDWIHGTVFRDATSGNADDTYGNLRAHGVIFYGTAAGQIV